MTDSQFVCCEINITITCEGEDEQQMLDEAVKLIESGLE